MRTSHQHLHIHHAALSARSDVPGLELVPGLDNSTDSIAYNRSSSFLSFTHGLNGVNQTANYLFVHALVLFFAGLVFMTFTMRLLRMLNAHIRHMSSMESKGNQTFWSQNRTDWWPKLKKHLIYAPLGRVRHNREVQFSRAVSVGTLPSRWHTLLLVAYLASNIAYCMVLDYSKKDKAAIIAELRGRSGVLAALNLIPTVLFALRNNPLIGILQVSYDTFNLLHRWTARIVLIEAFVHTAAWFANTASAGGLRQVGYSLQQSTSYTWGLVGTCTFLVMIIQAWSPVRHAFYETFLNIHRILAALAFVAVYVHLDTHKLPQVPWMQLDFLLWGLEWVFRTYRIVKYNVSLKGMTKVTVEALPSEACRVTFDLVRPWKYRPGSHAHIYIPSLAWHSSHPFSVAWSKDHTAGLPYTEKMPITPSANNTSSLDNLAEVTHSSISFVVRARTGFTRKLYDTASISHHGRFSTYGAVEGPYSGHDSLASYGTLVLFAGGVGITHQVGYVRELVAGYHAGTVACRKIILVWSVANTESLDWVRPWMEEILKMPGRRDVLKVLLFVSKPRRQDEIVSGSGSVQMYPGRCKPGTVVDNAIAERVGAVGITVCGPGAFADEVRAAARRRVEVGVVDFIEEAFTY